TRERGPGTKGSLLRIAHQYRDQRAEGNPVGLQHLEARLEGEEETVAPLARRDGRRPPGVVGGELVVERDDDRLLAGEVAIEEADADVRRLRDVAQRGRLVAARRDHPLRRRIQTVPADVPLDGLTGGPASFSRLLNISEHVH